MGHGGHAGEFEFLLGRDAPFQITRASIVQGDVLSLVLAPELEHLLATGARGELAAL